MNRTRLPIATQPRLAPPGHGPSRPARLSRRQFVLTATGTAAGVTLGVSLRHAPAAAASTPGTPRPIPGGFVAGDTLFHVFAPGFPNSDPADAEPATITDFDGVVGLAYLDGMCTRTNTKTGEVRRLPFSDVDMRFMAGVFRGTDGRVHQGTFGLI
jgi:hypothetical protein